MKGLFAYLDSNMKFTALELLLFSESPCVSLNLLG